MSTGRVGDDEAPGFAARRDGDVVYLVGEMASDTDAAMASAFADLLGAAAAGDLTLDMTGVRFCDSTGLNHLAGLRRSAGSDRTITLRGTRPLVRRVLEITGMDEVFAIEP